MPWTRRSAATSVVFNSKLWLFSGKLTGAKEIGVGTPDNEIKCNISRAIIIIVFSIDSQNQYNYRLLAIPLM